MEIMEIMEIMEMMEIMEIMGQLEIMRSWGQPFIGVKLAIR